MDRIVCSLWQAEVGHCVDLTPLRQGSRCCVVASLFFLNLPQLLFLLLQSLRVKTTATKIPLVALRYKQVNLSQVSRGVSTLSHLYLKYEFGLEIGAASALKARLCLTFHFSPSNIVSYSGVTYT